MMADLISREAAIEGLLAFCPERTEPGSLDEYGASVLYGVIDVVLKHLPAVDAVPVVRCRDCKYWETDWNPNNSMDGEHFCPMISLATSGDWYCADGERREATPWNP